MYQLRTNAICCRTIHRNFMKSCVRKKMFLENFVILPWHFLGRTEMKREIIFAYPANWSWPFNTYARLVNRQQSSGHLWTIHLFALIFKEVTRCGIILCPVQFLRSSIASCLLLGQQTKGPQFFFSHTEYDFTVTCPRSVRALSLTPYWKESALGKTIRYSFNLNLSNSLVWLIATQGLIVGFSH